MRVAEQIGKLIDLCYVRPWSALISRTMFRYAACGGANMVLDVVWYFVIYHYIVAERFIDLGFVVMSPHVASLVVVFPITFFTGFWLNRNVAFRVTEVGSGMQLVRYALSVVGSIYKTICRGTRYLAHTCQGTYNGRLCCLQLSCGTILYI